MWEWLWTVNLGRCGRKRCWPLSWFHHSISRSSDWRKPCEISVRTADIRLSYLPCTDHRLLRWTCLRTVLYQCIEKPSSWRHCRLCRCMSCILLMMVMVVVVIRNISDEQFQIFTAFWFMIMIVTVIVIVVMSHWKQINACQFNIQLL
jgi:hypothetical protein